MEPKKIILVVGGLIFAGGAVFVAMQNIGGEPPKVAVIAPKPKPAPPKIETEILVANAALPIGTILRPENVKFQPWPDNMVGEGYFVKANTDLDALMGTVLRQPIAAGVPLAKGMLVDPSDRGFLAAALSPGMRAVTMASTATTAAGQFIFPGDRVDVILSQEIPNAAGPSVRSSETIFENVRVLATDKRTEATKDKNKTTVEDFSNVTLELTPKMAEMFSVAQGLGTLSLSLRPITDNAVEFDRAIARGEINVPPNADPATIAKLASTLSGRPRAGNGTAITSGDVSRFLPRRPVAQPAPPPPSPIRVIRGDKALTPPDPVVTPFAPPSVATTADTSGRAPQSTSGAQIR